MRYDGGVVRSEVMARRSNLAITIFTDEVQNHESVCYLKSVSSRFKCEVFTN